MFYDFLGSDPDPEPDPVNLTGSGSDQKGLIKPDPDLAFVKSENYKRDSSQNVHNCS